MIFTMPAAIWRNCRMPTNADGMSKYQDEQVELADAIERTLQAIRERDGDKYFREVAGNLIDVIAPYIECHANDR